MRAATIRQWRRSTTPGKIAEAVDYAMRVATEAGARRLCLFRHDPWRSDDDLDSLVAEAKKVLRGPTEEVMAAAEGMTLTVATR